MSRPVVLCTGPMDAAGRTLLDGVTQVVLPAGAGTDDLAQALPQADYLVVRTFLPTDLLERQHRLRAIVRHGAGLDMIPMEAATRQGIPVAYVPGANAQAVAEYVVGSFFGLARRFGAADAELRAAGWAASRLHAAQGVELAGKTVGIIGVGAVGRRVAEICGSALGMTVLGYQPDPSRFPTFVASVPLDELLQRSDFVSVNCPLTETTHHLIDARRLALMKPTGFLVNAARGDVIDEQALVAALQGRAIAGAALDVFHEQPIAPGDSLLALDNVLLTPHIAALTRESVARMSVGSAQAILQLLRGERPDHLANPEVWAAWPHRTTT
jgi:D-3-phosphoglycerate dehydrogenase